MSTLKRALALILSLLMLFSLFSCEEYRGATGRPSVGGGSEEDDDEPQLNDDPTDDFTVTLKIKGQTESYSPRIDIDVFWSDGTSVHKAKVNTQGVARIDGLDGDYRITLSALPNELTYDPNAHIATNDSRNVVVDLYPINFLSGGGTGMYDCYQFSASGVYSATLSGPSDRIFFEYSPKAQGVYTIESWADVTADEINPFIDVYGGHSNFKYFDKTVQSGSSEGSYTINFKYQVQIVEEQISSAGQVSYTFAVGAESKYNQYPITVTFAVKINNEIEPTPLRPVVDTQTAVPKFDLTSYDKAAHENTAGLSVKYPEYAFNSNTFVLDKSLVALWRTEDGGDGFYHVYDEEKYAATGGFGPILYAKISQSCRFLDKSFSRIEYDRNGDLINKSLTVGGYNYKAFIEGVSALSTAGAFNGGNYFCAANCPCQTSADSTPAMTATDWVCPESCTRCNDSCEKCPDGLYDYMGTGERFAGYAAYANSDGGVAVNEDLQKFLQDFALSDSAYLFRDGGGFIDGKAWGKNYYQAPTGSEWLFACYYYE